MALHVRCGLGHLSLLPTSEDDKWVAAIEALRKGKAEQNERHSPVTVPLYKLPVFTITLPKITK